MYNLINQAVILPSGLMRDFHADDGDVLNIVLADDFGQLLGIVDVIELGTADEGDMAFDEIVVEAGIGIGCAVGGNQELSTVKVRCMGRNELELDRPLAKLGTHPLKGFFRSRRYGMGITAGAAPFVDAALGGHVFFDGLFVVVSGFAFDEGNGTGRAVGETVT